MGVSVQRPDITASLSFKRSSYFQSIMSSILLSTSACNQPIWIISNLSIYSAILLSDSESPDPAVPVRKLVWASIARMRPKGHFHMAQVIHLCHLLSLKFETVRDKTYKMDVRPAKTQISLSIRPV